MSQLRLGRLPDGTRDIRVCDDGAVGRASFTRYAIRGASIGDIVVTPKRRDRTDATIDRGIAHQADVIAREPVIRPRCGVLMRQSKEPCGRRPGHISEHRTAFAVACDAARRRR